MGMLALHKKKKTEKKKKGSNTEISPSGSSTNAAVTQANPLLAKKKSQLDKKKIGSLPSPRRHTSTLTAQEKEERIRAAVSLFAGAESMLPPATATATGTTAITGGPPTTAGIPAAVTPGGSGGTFSRKASESLPPPVNYSQNVGSLSAAAAAAATERSRSGTDSAPSSQPSSPSRPAGGTNPRPSGPNALPNNIGSIGSVPSGFRVKPQMAQIPGRDNLMAVFNAPSSSDLSPSPSPSPSPSSTSPNTATMYPHVTGGSGGKAAGNGSGIRPSPPVRNPLVEPSQTPIVHSHSDADVMEHPHQRSQSYSGGMTMAYNRRSKSGTTTPTEEDDSPSPGEQTPKEEEVPAAASLQSTSTSTLAFKGKTIEVIEQLGKGATATVWKASIDDHVVALKTVSLAVCLLPSSFFLSSFFPLHSPFFCSFFSSIFLLPSPRHYPLLTFLQIPRG
jgi:hypothetical protein